jgi:hypothetical protein
VVVGCPGGGGGSSQPPLASGMLGEAQSCWKCAVAGASSGAFYKPERGSGSVTGAYGSCLA